MKKTLPFSETCFSIDCRAANTLTIFPKDQCKTEIKVRPKKRKNNWNDMAIVTQETFFIKVQILHRIIN